ncbi:MAG: ABC transporter permease [Gemmatimonadota bacterium]|nr:ABC transporter permease [Gemmatimonadota bacterium]
MNVHRLLAVARKEAIQLRRDPRSLALAFALPLALVLFFGYAISFDVKNIELGVLDESRSTASRALIEAFVGSGYFTVATRLDRLDDAGAVLGGRRATLVLVIPPDFAEHLAAGRPAPLQALLDGSDASTASIAQNYADAVVAQFSTTHAAGAGGRALPLDSRIRIWYNETLQSRNMVVPGLVAVIMSIIAAMLTALTIAREWERGTMEQLAATPVHRLEVVLGKLLPYVVIGLVDVALAVVAGVFVFGVPFRGSVLLLAGLTLLFLLGVLGLGMFISAAVKSQLLATQAAILTTYLPALLLSGFVFAIASMPAALRGITYVVPARYYVAVTKGIFLKGVGVDVLWVDAVAMIVFASAGIALAVAAFRKELA